LLIGKPSTTKADMWSLGVMLYEMIDDIHPFQGDTPFLTLDKMRNAKPEPLYRKVTPYINEIIE
jgi:serine/threonine protein kinase